MALLVADYEAAYMPRMAAALRRSLKNYPERAILEI